MKHLLITLLLFFVLVCAVPGAWAQNTAPELKCGDSTGKTPAQQACCTNSVTSMYESQSAGATDIVPGALKSLFSAAFAVILPVFDKNPAISTITQPCLIGVPEGTGNSCKCVTPKDNFATAAASIRGLCERSINISGARHSDQEKKQMELDRNACIKCAVENNGLMTDLGCIPGDLSDFISNFVLRIGIGIAGFIALLCIIYSALTLQFSRGNPEMIQKAREQVTSCIIGLLMIIFSIFILRLIGVDILKIPGFS